ncbi:MAG: molybdopterin-dependent oxidoreductase [bacterium]|nr:molybdopterin-dependent oxidoreductase [bacterium]
MRRHSRRKFIRTTTAVGGGLALTSVIGRDGARAEELATGGPSSGRAGRQELLSQCPYCGVGCATRIKAQNGKIVGMLPDQQSPVNEGVLCIKGLTAWEPTYVDRLSACLVRKDMSDPINGHVSKTKGRFDSEVWREVSYEEASKIAAEKIAAIVKKFGGNSVGLYGSGQLTLEGQYLENKLMKGVLGSNTMEANARMCMTSAVTGYIKSLGSDAPPGCYDDIELCDFVSFWGHNPREAHPVLFWRAAAHKKEKKIATLVVDPRRTDTVKGFEDVDTATSYHAPVINADIAFLNSIAHVLIEKHPDVIDYDLLKKHVDGWEEYVDGVKKRYSPKQTQGMTGLDPKLVHTVAGHWAEATRKGKSRGTGGVLTFWGIGYNQSMHGQHNAWSIINLHLLTGNIGRPGAGPFSQTGQPNAMGERLTGGLTDRLPFNVGIGNEKHRDWIAENWNVSKEALANVAAQKNPGYAIGMMERALKGDVHAMFLIYATHIDLPETKTLVRPALERTFLIAQDIYRHAPNLLYADVVFPAATWGEWAGGVYINSERRLYVTDGTGQPPAMTLDGEPVTDEAGQPVRCKPDMDIVIDKSIEIADLLGLDGKKLFPYKKLANGMYDPEEVLREFLRASRGTDADLTGLLAVEEQTGKSPYQQLRELRGIYWPAPTAKLALEGGIKRRYLGQEEGWKDKPYGAFRTASGKALMKLCEQTYEDRESYIAKLRDYGVKEGHFTIDHIPDLVAIRDRGLTPELPDFEWAGKPGAEVPEGKYPFWLLLGVVYEHFHSAKTIRGATTRRLVPEQYVEMHAADAESYGIEDGDWVRVSTRRGSYQGRAQIDGADSKIRPARNNVQAGMIFSPWNLSVADSADPAKNEWLVNETSHRAWDPVSGQSDFKKLAARIEKVRSA